jgi:integrase
VNRPHFRVRRHRDGSRSFWFDQGGTPRRWQLLGHDEAKAIAAYERIVAKPKPEPGTVDQMLADAIEAMRGKVKPGTLVNYGSYRKHLAAVFIDPPETITQADVLKYLRLCPRWTFRNEIGLLSLSFVHWMNEGRLDFNPCFGVRIKRKGSKRDRLLAAGEIQAIIDAADERTAIAIELGYATGLRIADLCALRWADLAGTVETQKTGARLEIEASDVLTPILARARASQARVASLYVLCARGGRRWSTEALRDHWNKAVKAAEVPNAHFHDLRAAAATAIEREQGQAAAQQFLGHRDARTTLVYLRGLRVNVVRPLARKA